MQQVILAFALALGIGVAGTAVIHLTTTPPFAYQNES